MRSRERFLIQQQCTARRWRNTDGNIVVIKVVVGIYLIYRNTFADCCVLPRDAYNVKL